MAICQTDNTKLFGRAVILEVADGCADTVPTEADFKLLMPGTSKTFDMSPNTTTSSADDTKGWVENIVTSNDLTLSFEGEVRVNDRSDQYGVYKYIKYYVAEVNAGRQPTLWVRMTFGQIQIQGYMVITALSNDGGTDDIVTLSTEFKVADGSTVQVTDVADDVAVTGVTVAPKTASIAVAATRQLTATIAPADASNTAVTWSSSDATKATVSNTGLVTGVAAGTATITVTTADGAKTDTAAITVTA
ncbi:Ig-like domain-containing protein [Cedecea sp. P7760]|uniref:Ig-like domain-containing protein n=1 Tax=Cedecea sp. P7760 TaxID=2726983 RepID=UPI0015A4903E|nr:Ig-like domain-containing protein [Cedecea sp. P7760]NWC63752.1 Ig domain-containing protein [Cedecea sp. P7760]